MFAFSALTGWILFSGMMASIGSTITRLFVIPRASAGDPTDPAWEQSAADVGLVGACMAFVGLLMVGLRQLIEFRDPFVPWTEDAALLLSLEWGTAWKAAVAGSVLLVVAATLLRSGRRWALLPTGVLGAALSFFPAFTGHANGAEEFRALALTFDGLHVVGAGAWIGSLCTVLVIEASLRRRNPTATALPRLVPAFSPVAVGGVAVLIATGAFAMWLHIPDRSTLTGTGYGGTLLVKLALVIVALTLGAQNARVLTPKLHTEDGVTELRRTAMFELAIAQLILIVTAVLVRTSPMDH